MTQCNWLPAKDVAHHLHPFTDLARHQETGPFVISKGDGVHVIDERGRRYIEGVSGLWSVALGFSEQRLIDAAVRQFSQLPYYHSFAHKAHEPAIELAAKLAGMCPARLNHVHFTNSGSEANDTVVKMLWYYNNAAGRPRKKTLLSRRQAYHGSTIATASLTGLPLSHRDFDLPAIPVRHLSCPHFYRFGLAGESEAAFVERLGQELEEVIEVEGADTIAAFIAEPLMAAGGVIPAPAGYWQKMQAICRRHGILIVVDEIITGFGRLGTLFGSDYYGIDPDIMVLSKQLTSSYQPLAAVVISDDIHAVITGNSGKLGTFGHGFTTTGHPVATAVALENITIIEERGLVANAAAMGTLMRQGLQRLAEHPLVGNVRGSGLIAGVELVADKAEKRPFAQLGTVGGYIFRRAHEYGLIIRNIQDTIAFCPPLIIDEGEMASLLMAFERTLEDAERWIASNSIK